VQQLFDALDMEAPGRKAVVGGGLQRREAQRDVLGAERAVGSLLAGGRRLTWVRNAMEP
jgi:hypothetical protein